MNLEMCYYVLNCFLSVVAGIENTKIHVDKVFSCWVNDETKPKHFCLQRPKNLSQHMHLRMIQI